MKNREYEDRLKIWNITSLTEIRRSEDLFQNYKIKSNLETINWFTGSIQGIPLRQTRSATNNEQRLIHV